MKNSKILNGVASVVVGAALLVGTVIIVRRAEQLKATTGTLFSATPLMDLGTGTYEGFEGGLYEGGSNSIPADHDADGLTQANLVQPLDTNGNPSISGKIVFTSIGMSNAAEEFGTFMVQAISNSGTNNVALHLNNGATGGAEACWWTNPYGAPPCALRARNQYDRIDNQLAAAGYSGNQVQVMWLKDADRTPAVKGFQPLCDPSTVGCSNTVTGTEALHYEEELGQIVRAAKTRWPNLKLAFLASRIYAGYADNDVNPEPYAYEYGFSVKWLIQAQIDQARNGTIDSVAGDLSYGVAPWLAWGTYIWADGPVPRSDGLVWCDGQAGAPCNGEIDFQPDGNHPNATGQAKVAGLLMNFFLASPEAAWFR